MILESWLKSKGILEPVEQFAHFWMGVGASLVNLGLLLWWREWVQQWPPGDALWVFVDEEGTPVDVALVPPGRPVWPKPGRWKKYAPLDRVKDTGTDLFWMEVGRTVGWFVVLGLMFFAGQAVAGDLRTAECDLERGDEAADHVMHLDDDAGWRLPE